MKRYLSAFLMAMVILPVAAQTEQNLENKVNELLKENESLNHRLDVLEKKIDDVTWFHRVGDLAFIDKVYIYGLLLQMLKIPNKQVPPILLSFGAMYLFQKI